MSTDGGRSFERRAAPELPLDVVFDPRDPQRMLVATAQGLFSSSDGGGSWRPRDPVASEQLAWAAPDAAYRADPGTLYASIPGGEIHRSTDGGATWKRLLRLE